MGSMGDRAAKDALFDAFAEVAKALASGRRAEIADLLAQGERPVEEIAAEIGQSVANTSHHLRAMARAGLVVTRRDGTRIFYRLASERVGELWAAMRDVAAEHVAGLEHLAAAYLGERDGIEVVGRKELAARLKRGEVMVLDVRPPAEYESGHIRGARSAPIAELRRHLRALPPGVEVVAYCRGPYCVYAADCQRRCRCRSGWAGHGRRGSGARARAHALNDHHSAHCAPASAAFAVRRLVKRYGRHCGARRAPDERPGLGDQVLDIPPPGHDYLQLTPLGPGVLLV